MYASSGGGGYQDMQFGGYQSGGGYQDPSIKNQTEAFFSRIQEENASRPEWVQQLKEREMEWTLICNFFSVRERMIKDSHVCGSLTF